MAWRHNQWRINEMYNQWRNQYSCNISLSAAIENGVKMAKIENSGALCRRIESHGVKMKAGGVASISQHGEKRHSMANVAGDGGGGENNGENKWHESSLNVAHRR